MNTMLANVSNVNIMQKPQLNLATELSMQIHSVILMLMNRIRHYMGVKCRYTLFLSLVIIRGRFLMIARLAIRNGVLNLLA